MSKTKIFVAFVGVLLVGSALYWMQSANKKTSNDVNVVGSTTSQTTSNSSDNNQASTNSSGNNKVSFSDFIKNGGFYRCTVTQGNSAMSNDGLIYVSKDKIRGEFKTETQGMSIDTNFILRDGYSYTWSSLAPGQGARVKMAEGSGDGSVTSAFDTKNIIDYDCQPWSGDESKFVLPNGVNFYSVGD